MFQFPAEHPGHVRFFTYAIKTNHARLLQSLEQEPRTIAGSRFTDDLKTQDPRTLQTTRPAPTLLQIRRLSVADWKTPASADLQLQNCRKRRTRKTRDTAPPKSKKNQRKEKKKNKANATRKTKSTSTKTRTMATTTSASTVS
jgi:hypothetical protein